MIYTIFIAPVESSKLALFSFTGSIQGCGESLRDWADNLTNEVERLSDFTPDVSPGEITNKVNQASRLTLLLSLAIRGKHLLEDNLKQGEPGQMVVYDGYTAGLVPAVINV